MWHISIRRALLVLVLAAALSVAMPIKVSAHRSGCHRWHSCPSDTGSYTCGDLGYDTYCPTYTEPDYEKEGYENGRDKADKNSESIEQAGRSDGDRDGYGDGNLDNPENRAPDATETCDRRFTFDGYAPDEYKDAYHDAYEDACEYTYNDAYDSGYTEGYDRGQDDYAKTNQKLEDSSLTAQDSNQSSTSWFWPTMIAGGGAWYLFSLLKGSGTTKRK